MARKYKKLPKYFKETLESFEKNFERNIKGLNILFEDFFSQNKAIKRSIYGIDSDIFEIALNRAKSDLKKGCSKGRYESIKKFITKYKDLAGYKRLSTVSKKLMLATREEYIGNFIGLGYDAKLLKLLETTNLMNDYKFWTAFFNSPYYTPLYDFPISLPNDDSEAFFYVHGASYWGKNIYEFVKQYIKENKRK